MGTLAQMTGAQTFLIDKMSELVIRESSESSETSLDEEFDNIDYLSVKVADLKKMTTSKNLTDRRLINSYLLHQAHKKRHIFGYDNDLLLNRQEERPKAERFGLTSEENSASDVHYALLGGLETIRAEVLVEPHAFDNAHDIDPMPIHEPDIDHAPDPKSHSYIHEDFDSKTRFQIERHVEEEPYPQPLDYEAHEETGDMQVHEAVAEPVNFKVESGRLARGLIKRGQQPKKREKAEGKPILGALAD